MNEGCSYRLIQAIVFGCILLGLVIMLWDMIPGFLKVIAIVCVVWSFLKR